MPTPKEEVRRIQKQVRIDFAAYHAQLGGSAQKVVDLLNAKAGKKSERSMLTLGEFRQLMDKRLTEADLAHLKLLAKHIPTSTPPAAT